MIIIVAVLFILHGAAKQITLLRVREEVLDELLYELILLLLVQALGDDRYLGLLLLASFLLEQLMRDQKQRVLALR